MARTKRPEFYYIYEFFESLDVNELNSLIAEAVRDGWQMYYGPAHIQSGSGILTRVTVRKEISAK